MRRVTVELPTWIGKEEAQEEVIRDLRARAVLKMEYYRSKVRLFESKHATTFARFQRRVEKAPAEDPAAWDDLIEWEAHHRAHQQWKKRHAELRRWSQK